MNEVKIEPDAEMKKEDESLMLLQEPTIVMVSPPSPFLPDPGEPAVPWDRWRKSFEQYLEVFSDMNLDSSSKCALLQNCLGLEGQRVYRTLVQDDTSFTEAVFTLTIHFTSNDNPQMFRFKFRQRAQKPDESIEQFVSGLRELVRPCNYGDFEDEFILDQLIEKTSCVHLKEKLLFGQRTMTLAGALIIAQQVEYAIRPSASPSDHNMTLRSEETSHLNSEDFNDVQKIAGGVRTRGSERRKTQTLPGLNKDKNHYFENDESQTGGSCNGNDDTGIDNTEDEDYEFDDVKDKDYEVGDNETDEDSDFDDAKNKHREAERNRHDVADEDWQVAGNKEATSSSIEKKEHACPICFDKSFKHSSKLSRHMLCHTKARAFSCPVCAMAFSHSWHMKRHIKNIHRGYVETKDKGKNFHVTGNEMEECDHNDAKGKDGAVDREAIKEKDFNNAKGKDGAVNKDVIKEKNFNDAKGKDEAVDREAIKEKDFNDAKGKDGAVDEEAIKEKDFNDAKGKDGTVQREAIKEKDFNDATDDSCEANVSKEAISSTSVKNKLCCPICRDRHFRSPSGLARHIRSHTDKTPFSCPVCAKVFTQSFHMTRHLRVQHEGYINANDKDPEVTVEEMQNKSVSSCSESSSCPGDEVFSPDTRENSCPDDRSFRRPVRLTRHTMTHSQEKLRCSVCAAGFSLAELLGKHIRSKHRGCNICCKCGESFGSSADLISHYSTHAKKTREKLTCPVCYNKFHGSNALSAHMKAHGPIPPPSSCHFTCYVCEKKFPRMYSLKRHLTTHDGEFNHHLHQQNLRNRLAESKIVFTGSREKPHCCVVCGRTFTYEYALKNHAKKHVEAPFYCSKCNKHFTERAIFERHQSIHLGRQCKCPHCEDIFTSFTSFKSHLRTHVKERPYQCSYCVESFTQEEERELHCLKHRKFKKEKPYSCSRCSYAFASIEALTEHMVIHKGEPPMTCPDCGRTFLNKSKLEKHMSIHAGKSPHLCTHCGRSFTVSTTLKAHMLIHTGEKPFKCTQCSKGFRLSSELRAHSRIHMAVRPSYQCSDCGRKYGRTTELKLHQRSHTGDKPYVCTVCGKRFIIKNKLNVHMRIHTGERPYSCSECGQTFTQSGDRNRHMIKYHS